MSSVTRPLSPHLQVYRPQWTSVLSILHRGTGVVLCIGLLGLVYWLVALALGPDAFARAQAVMSSAIGRILLFLWTIAFFYHLCNGVRHLAWDAGLGLEIESAYASGKLVVGATAVLTIVAWVLAFTL